MAIWALYCIDKDEFNLQKEFEFETSLYVEKNGPWSKLNDNLYLGYGYVANTF